MPFTMPPLEVIKIFIGLVAEQDLNPASKKRPFKVFWNKPKMMFVLPDKKWLALIFVLALVNPLNYAALILFPSEGKTFVGYGDDGLMLSIMQAPARGF